jgi:chemotaxis protein methyltransferase CheR
VTTFSSEADGFLAWALPQRGLRWRGFRRNRRQVHRRLRERIVALGLAGCDAYRAYLADHPDEWPVLDSLCRVTISRFARDREMWTVLVADVLPRLASRGSTIRAWSAGCGAGEEPFTLAIAWALEIATAALDVIGTDIDDSQLARAAAATFPASALRELPDHWRAAAFDERDGEARVRDAFRARVRFAHHDLRAAPLAGPFDLVLCRNLAYSYFDGPTQEALTSAFHSVMLPGSVLVVGGDERLCDEREFAPSSHGIYIAR